MKVSFELLQATVPHPEDSYELGIAAGHIVLSKNPKSSALGALGLQDCGIGGYKCSCNQARLLDGVDVYDFVAGVDSARTAVKDKVVV